MAHRVPANNYRMLFPPDQSVEFDVQAFDDNLQTHGVSFVHWKALPCPVGLTDIYDMRSPHEDHSGCSGDFLHKRAGIITGIFIANTKQFQYTDPGLAPDVPTIITLPRYYDDCPNQKPLVALFDRFYLLEENIVVPHNQLFEANQSGVDKVAFPIVCVLDIVDSNGKFYSPEDYQVIDGKIHWLGSNRPGYDIRVGRGQICSIRYTYRPYWYVKSLLHEVRVTQRTGESGERLVERMPQQVMLQREYVYEKEQRDSLAPDPNSLRQYRGPRNGSFGPR